MDFGRSREHDFDPSTANSRLRAMFVPVTVKRQKPNAKIGKRSIRQ